MKKSLILILLIMLVSGTRANLAWPKVYISEILADSAGNWTLEIGFIEYYFDEFDSLEIVTSFGSSYITSCSLLPGGEYSCFDSLAVITDANLGNPLSINPEGDFVRLISYIWGAEEFDYVPFGNYPGSDLDCILPGESVSYYGYNGFCMDSSPTIGSGNDDGIGITGLFSGIAYDLSGIPFEEGTIYIIGNAYLALDLNDLAGFNEFIGSRRYTFDTILLRMPPPNYAEKKYTVEPVDFCLRPDSSYYQDIVTTSLVEGIEDEENDDENMVTIAPNPFSDKVIFYFNLTNEFLSDELSLSIYDLNGREIHHNSFIGDLKRYEWVPAGQVSSGTYIYRLEKDHQLIKTGKFVRS